MSAADLMAWSLAIGVASMILSGAAVVVVWAMRAISDILRGRFR
jgi:hypothetical protein